MSTSATRTSAKIYQFSDYRRVRASIPAEVSSLDVAAIRFANVSSGSGWYHDAAIEESRQALTRHIPGGQ